MAQPNKYFIGEVVTLSGAFTNPAGAAVDPSVVTFNLREPDATFTAFVFGVDAELIRDGIGLYHVDWTTAKVGSHCWGLAGTGTAQAISEGEFEVEARCSVAP
jgi:hypothetical protein